MLTTLVAWRKRRLKRKMVMMVIPPLIPKTIHTIPPDKDYVAPATKSMLDELLEEFGEEILNATMVNEEADFIPTNDIQELERLLAKYPQSHFTEIQVDRDMTSPECYTGNAHGVVLGCYSSCKEAFQAGLVGCYIGDDDELLGSWMLLKEADLEHGLEHDVSSSYQANLREFSILFLTLPILILYAYI
ncbi:hypothetical protein Tco_0480847 [Tanacetum coccineum]